MYDIAFLHPPASFEKLRYPLSGVLGAQVASSDLLEHEPAGMLSLAVDLSRRGYAVRVFNVARMVLRLRGQALDRPDLEALLDGVEARIFAIDLHWAAHAPGALDLAAMLKGRYPQSVVVLGGITATYYHEEILQRFSVVDLVALGEVDGLLHRVVEGLLDGAAYGDLPNIAYRAEGQTVRSPREPPIKRGLHYVSADHLDLVRPAPEQPARSVFVPLLHGCRRSCPFCGGGSRFYGEYFCRREVEHTPVGDVITSARAAADMGAGTIWLTGDPRDAGDGYWQELAAALAGEALGVDLYMELFSLADEAFLETWRATTTGQVLMAFSPESADEDIRRAMGKRYDNRQIVEQVHVGHELGITISLGFSFPLPGQDLASLRRTLDFIEALCRDQQRLVSYMFEPLLLLDPGSPIFDAPEAYGYEVPDRTLAGMISSLSLPHWSYSVNASTRWMNRAQLLEAVFAVGRVRNRLQARYHGLSAARWFHHRLLEQHRAFIDRSRDLEGTPNKEALASLVRRTIDADLLQCSYSPVAPELEYAALSGDGAAVGDLFPATGRVVWRCAEAAGREEELLGAAANAGLFEEVPGLAPQERALLDHLDGHSEAPTLDLPWARQAFTATLEALGWSVEDHALDGLLLRDWLGHGMKLRARGLRASHEDSRWRVDDATNAEVLLPPRAAFIETAHDHDGPVALDGTALTLDRGPGCMVISHEGEGVLLEREVFELLWRCAPRVSVLELWLLSQDLGAEPVALLRELLSRQVALLIVAGRG